MPCFSEAWRSYIPFFILKFASGQSILVEFIKTHNIYITHTIMKKIFLSSTFLIMCALLVKAENLKLWYKQPGDTMGRSFTLRKFPTGSNGLRNSR